MDINLKIFFIKSSYSIMLFMLNIKNKCIENIIEWKYFINILLYRVLELKNMI